MDEDFGYQNLIEEEIAQKAEEDVSSEQDMEDEKWKHVQGSNFQK
jgi:hypothetical protein